MTQQTCPSPEMLTQIVSGNLPEVEAEQVFAHVEQCPDCQQRLDRLAHRADSLLQVARRALQAESNSPTSERGNLNDLIRRAQRVGGADGGSGDDTQVDARGKTEIVSRDRFIKAVRQCGLWEEAEVERWVDEVESTEERRQDDSSALAQALVRQRKLTPFQARLLVRGRWRGLILGKYEIIDQLAAGGMGKLFIGRHRQMGRIVCIKMVHAQGEQTDQMMDRFQNEVRVLGALSHPSIVAAHDADHSSVGPYLVMEYVEGRDLAKHVRTRGPLSVQESLKVVLDVAWAMDYAHKQGVVHRDIKPHNLLLEKGSDDSPVVKILDLGLAKFDTMLSDNPDASLIAAMTNTGVVIGTVDYMAPEQALDSRTADGRSDIYSLGCTLYFLVTGRPPFSGETVMQRLVAHREKTPAPLLELRPELDPKDAELGEQLLERMLAKRPEQRYQTMADLARDVERVMRGEQLAPIPPAGVAGSPARAIPPRVSRQPADSVSVADLGVSEVTLAAPVSAATLTAAVETPYIPQSPTVSLHDVGVAVAEPSLVTPMIADPLATPVMEGRPLVAQKKWSHAGHAKWAGIATIGGVLLIIGLIVLAVSPPRTGADLAIKNGGPGRALILVSSLDFKGDEYHSLIEALEKTDVRVVTASPNYGDPDKEDFGAELKAVTDNVSLDEVAPEEYDAVFFLSGDKNWNRDMIHKNKENHQKLIQLVEQAGKNNTMFGAIRDGYRVLEEATAEHVCLSKLEDGVDFCKHNFGGFDAAVVKAHEVQHVPRMVEKILQLARNAEKTK